MRASSITLSTAGRKVRYPENASFYNAVISAHAKPKDLMEMERVFRQMKGKLCLRNSTTYSVMIDAYRKEGMHKISDLEQEKLGVIAQGPDSDETGFESMLEQ